MFIEVLFKLCKNLDVYQNVNEENVIYMHNGALFSHKELNYVICWKMSATGDRRIK